MILDLSSTSKMLKRKMTFNRVTIVLTAGSKMPVISGKWKRLPNGCIRAWYTLDEYEKCLSLFELRKQVEPPSAPADQDPI